MHSTLRTLVRPILACLSMSFFILPASAMAAPTIRIVSPKSGFSAGSPVFYEADATPSCPLGISSVSIYSAPGVIADKAIGPRYEGFVYLPPGSYNTVVQAKDGCGGVAKTPVAVTVSSAAGVSVFLPNRPSASSPVHFAASAQSPDCPSGISAMRIYTSWGYTPYTVGSNQLDAFVVLQAAEYYATMQAWDNCGNVFKTNFQVKSNGGDSDGYLYSISQSGVISEFQVTSDGTLVNPNGSGDPPQFEAAVGARSLSIDPGGQFAYTAAPSGVYGYQIDPANGALTPAIDSPFKGLNNPSFAYVEPSGNFVFVIYADNTAVAGFLIDRSTGYLGLSVTLTPGGTLTTLATALWKISLCGDRHGSDLRLQA
jgi:hypothetical protein